MNAKNKLFLFNTLIKYTFIISSLLTLSCEDNERIYRPDLSEKLCCVGIIDIDDSTLRYISFEKSFQSEYADDINDSLRNFSFSISNLSSEIFHYQCDSTIKELHDFKIPGNIIFNPREKYFLSASENEIHEISAEIEASSSPSNPILISYDAFNTILNEPIGCNNIFDVRTVRIKFSFQIDVNLNYAIFLEGWGTSFSSAGPKWPGYMDFTVVDCNIPGFLSPVYGLRTYHFPCNIKLDPTYAFFVQGKNASDSKCVLTISVQYRDGFSIFDSFKAIGIKLISIPPELYAFEKSLYTYSKVVDDPFSEPIYINGNIKGGIGVFAICRSKELKVTFPDWI